MLLSLPSDVLDSTCKLALSHPGAGPQLASTCKVLSSRCAATLQLHEG